MAAPSEENKTLVSRAIDEALNRRRLRVLDELLATDAVWYGVTPGRAWTTEEMRAGVAALLDAFPDLAVTIEDEVAEGGRVATRWSARGTHADAFLGVPPTGRHVSIGGILMTRVADGRVLELWGQVDLPCLLHQLGVPLLPLPPPPHTAV